MKESKQSRKKKRILKELETHPIASRAYKRAGVSHATFYRWCQEDSKFQVAVERAQATGRKQLVDFSESKLLENISNNQLGAIQFFLSHNEPRYRPHVIKAQTDYIDRLESDLWLSTEIINHLIDIVGIQKVLEVLGFANMDEFTEVARQEEQKQKLRRRPKKWMPYPRDSDSPYQGP